ncbi:MAG: VWA domain-containing protein [Acidobacteriaceae bacterium]
MLKLGMVLGLVLVSCGAGCPSGWAQDAAAAGPLVRFNVEVTDKAGHPVTGLQQSDFTVLDGGKPTTIASFTAHAIAAAAPAAEAHEESIMLVIDDIDMDFLSMGFERTQIENALRANGGHLSAPVSISIMTESGLQPIVDGSADGNHVADELHAWQAHLQKLPSEAEWGRQERWLVVMDALHKILSYEEGRSGRKLVIWISPGWPMFVGTGLEMTDKQMHWYMDLIVDTSNRMREAETTMEVADPAGAGNMYESVWKAYTKPVKKWDKAAPGNVGLQVLALQSGGQVAFSSNGLTGELLQCMSDGTAWYSLAIPQQPGEKGNLFRDVQVKVNQPGLTVRTGNGYYVGTP